MLKGSNLSNSGIHKVLQRNKQALKRTNSFLHFRLTTGTCAPEGTVAVDTALVRTIGAVCEAGEGCEGGGGGVVLAGACCMTGMDSGDG